MAIVKTEALQHDFLGELTFVQELVDGTYPVVGVWSLRHKKTGVSVAYKATEMERVVFGADEEIILKSLIERLESFRKSQELCTLENEDGTMTALKGRYNQVLEKQKQAEALMFKAIAALENDQDALPPPTDIGMYSLHWDVTNETDGISYTSTVKLVVTPSVRDPQGSLVCVVLEDQALYVSSHVEDLTEVPSRVRSLIAGRTVHPPRK